MEEWSTGGLDKGKNITTKARKEEDTKKSRDSGESERWKNWDLVTLISKAPSPRFRVFVIIFFPCPCVSVADSMRLIIDFSDDL
jgi:hypothetical protein